jgi:hypothetical protein
MTPEEPEMQPEDAALGRDHVEGDHWWHCVPDVYAIGMRQQRAVQMAQRAQAAESRVAELTKALRREPETLPEPIGPTTRRWWRLGWLSAQTVALDSVGINRKALAEPRRNALEADPQ